MRVRLNNQALGELISRSPFSQNHWAIKCGLSKGHLADIVNGKHPYPSPETREKLLDNLEASFDDLFEIIEPQDGIDEKLDLKARFQAALADRYVIDDVIGQGGMGTVYLARDVKHGRPVAIKVVFPDAIDSLGNQSFLKEIRLTAALQHPNIITLLDSGEEVGCPYLVAPFVRDGSLRQLMNDRGRFRVSEALGILSGICEALQYAHDNHAIHCDIKPENILVSSGRAMVTDFGISRAIHVEGHSWRKGIDTSSGTAAYVSPEQASGDQSIGAKTDQYSVACLLFEMLTGEPPFKGANALAIISQRFLAEPPDASRLAPEVSWAVSTAVAKGMAVDPKRRFASITEFFEEVDHAATHGTRSMAERWDAAFSSSARSLWRAFENALGERFAATAKGFFESNNKTPKTAVGSKGGFQVLSATKRDVAYAMRTLRRRPGFTALMVLTLALGIGVNSAIYSIVNTILLKPLPFPNAERLAYLSETTVGGRSDVAFAYPNLVDLEEQNQSFEEIASYAGGSMAIGGGEAPLFAPAYYTTQNFFEVFGSAPMIGSTVAPDLEGSYATLSNSLWRTAFGSDPAVVGREITLNGATVPIIAVMPAGFAYPAGASLWVQTELRLGPSRTAHNLRAIGLLKNGVTIEQGDTEASQLARRIVELHSDEVEEDLDFSVQSLHTYLSGDFRSTLLLLEIVVGLVLLIACGNLASVLMARALTRSREMAIRRSVGATSTRLVAQLLTESTLVGLMGATVGLILAASSLGLVNKLVPAQYLHSGSVRLDSNVVLFTLALGTVTGILFGLAPAWKSTRFSPQEALRASGANPGMDRKKKVGGLLVIPQYAFSFAALVVAGLVVKSLVVLTAVDPGFDLDGLATFDLSLPTRAPSRYSERAAIASFHQDLLSQVSQIPGVSAATLDNAPPLKGAGRVNGAAWLEGNDSDDWDIYPDWRVVGPDFFSTMGLQMERGRDIDRTDGAEALPVVVVNQTFVAQAWGADDPIGKRIRLSSLDNNSVEASRWLTVVGVVTDFHSRGLNSLPRAAIFAPVGQHMDRAGGVDLLIRLSTEPETILPAVRQIIRNIDPTLAVGRAQTLEAMTSESLAEPRFRAGLLTGFGVLALSLALLGVYGVMSHSVSGRKKEMAVRMALGARRETVVILLMKEALGFAIWGQLLGLLFSFYATKLLTGMLFEVKPLDPVVFGAVSLALAFTVFAATWIPARRAGNVGPAEVLKEQ